MKKKKIIYFGLMFLPLLINLIALQFMPEKIPAHYDFDGHITRWGSKYEALIYPVFTILMGYFLLTMSKVASEQEENGKNNEKVVLVTGIALLIFFNCMNIFALYKDFNKIENLSSLSVSIYQLVFGLLGLFMIIIGNVMPKLRMNSIIGLRTPWSLRNEFTWKKSQHFGGISFILSGIVIIIISLFAKDFSCIVLSMITLVLSTVIDTIYTYRISKKC